MAAGSPVSVSLANLTFANVPSPMVRPSSYFPTRLFTFVVLIPCLILPLESQEASTHSQMVSRHAVALAWIKPRNAE
uniref:Uncharacterized protein n=1 Tax=Arundo donax TaxID=35708 RepID=A0A0A9DB47_ARUDO